MIRKGDMVRVGATSALHGVVLKTSREGATRGHLHVRPICRDVTGVRDVRTNEVTGHWRLVNAK